MNCSLIGALVSTVVAIHPIELDDVISNPGMGWQSFYTTKNNDPSNAGIPSQAAYIRYYWSTAIGVVGPATRKPVVKLAIRGRDANGWYPPSTVSISGTNYQLVWSDEFNGTSVDASKWNEVGPWGKPVSSTGNFSYSPSNVSVSNGAATITARRSGNAWTGGILSTDTTKQFQYGFVEVRAKIPAGQGFWPAIWLYGNSGAPELDVMESIGDASTAYQTYHFPGGQHGAQASNLSPDYHLFQMKWEPGKITYYVDNVQTGTWTDNVPSDPMFLMLNFDVGGPGDWSGAPDSSTPSPATFNIDYVRVYGSRLRHPRPRGPSHRSPGRAAK
ncbi:MAG: glycoside hydrolase family 16 protein [Planctomycetaceae bacterium]|nr:glycoside hydrolase family 16 protein [Planctomycetaceae bacterium]